MTSHLCLGDIHTPEHDERALKVAIEILQYTKPDILHIMGDVGEFASVSPWDKRKRGKVEGRRLAKDFAAVNRILDRLNAATKALIIFYEGNHEYWCQRRLDEQPELEGLISVKEQLKIAERGFEFIPYGGKKLIEGVYFTHTIDGNGGVHHTKRSVLDAGKPIVYGHRHDIQLFDCKSWGHSNTGASIGHLRKKNASFLRGRPTNWQHGIGIVYTMPKAYQIYPIRIYPGKTVWGGKVF